MSTAFDTMNLEGPAPSVSRLEPDRPFTYREIPFLQQLLPRHGGLPGVTYLQVALEHIKEAQDKGFRPVDDTRSYTIIGPNGAVNCALYGWGSRIKGGDPSASLRLCYVDGKLEWATGLAVRDALLLKVTHIERPPAKPEPATAANPQLKETKGAEVQKS